MISDDLARPCPGMHPLMNTSSGCPSNAGPRRVVVGSSCHRRRFTSGVAVTASSEVRVADSIHGTQGLFAGTAWHYARYRPSYPEALFDDLIRRFGLDGTGRILDLGCGTGQLTLPLAAHVDEAVGVDPDPEMLAEAAQRSRETGVTNVTWAQGSSADLGGGYGRFRLVTMGRSFHWMDRGRVLALLEDMVDDSGGLIIANDSCLVRPATVWQRAIERIQARFLPADFVPPVPPSGRADDDGHLTHEEVLGRSQFRRVDRRTYEFERVWTVEQAIGYLYSTSLPLRRVLGEERTAFEHTVRAELLTIDSSGRFAEPVTLEVLTATRP
ncbi:class I SAM-dependent methyltransferase [Nocardia sp. NPDC050799]|uniref:class I SAM-dependent methyltransferase n=1 Tax=Nocardia sp. NPDC050799 TaxID=3154842 RepID=UPI0033D1E933